MGGLNQNTCPPVAVGQVARQGAIRYHENTALGEVHFHDDVNGLKCAISTPVFVAAYHDWRKKNSVDPLELIGYDGSKRPTAVKFVPFVNKSQIDVGIEVMTLGVSNHLSDLDVLAGWK